MKTTLFLHMGPGLNAYPERNILQDTFPEIDFWDQPDSQGENAFEELVNAAVERILEIKKNSGHSVPLLAHSFGGHIAARVIALIPDAVASLTLFNPGHDIPGGFHHLIQLLSRDSGTEFSLRQNMELFLRDHPVASPEQIWSMVGLLIQDPAFMRLYWQDPQFFAHHTKLSLLGPPLKFESFQDIIRDFLRKFHSHPNRLEWKGNAKLILGEYDPLVASIETTTAYWKGLFPNVQLEVRKNSGHFSHLEDALRTKLKNETH